MSFALYSSPSLLDILTVCRHITDDQKAQMEAFSGEAYHFERTAMNYAQADGPSWVMCENDQPIAVAGFLPIRKGVWQDWMITTDRPWEKDAWRAITRYTRRIMDGMMEKHAHRLQCVSLASRIAAHKWYPAIGYTYEATLRGYAANGEDVKMFARVK